MLSPEESVEIMAQESLRLVAYLKTLPAEAWQQPSACELWTVADVVGHMVYVMEMITGGVSRGIKGDITPPPGWPAAGGEEVARHQFLNHAATARRERLGNQLLPTYEQLVHRTIAMAAALRPDDWDKPYYRPLGIRPVRNFLPTVITETAMHRWDIQSQLDTSPHFSPESLAVFMASMPRLRQFQPGPKLASPLRYRFAVSAPIPFQGDIVIAGDTVHSEPVGTAAPALTFHCDTETFVLLMYGRLTYAASIANGRLGADGHRELVAKFARRLGP